VRIACDSGKQPGQLIALCGSLPLFFGYCSRKRKPRWPTPTLSYVCSVLCRAAGEGKHAYAHVASAQLTTILGWATGCESERGEREGTGRFIKLGQAVNPNRRASAGRP
jgi:hypothetical protein